MKDARRLLLDQFEILRFQRESRFTDVSFNDLKVVVTLASELNDATKLFSRPRQQRWLHQQDETALGACEPFQQAIGDETGKTRDEKCLSIRHGLARV